MLYRFLIVFLFLFVSCKKDLISSRIEGVVYGTTSKKPISGASIDLVSSSNNRLEYISTVYTDEFGNFEIPKFKRDSRKAYHLYCQHPDYFDIKYFPIKEKIFKEKFEFDLQEPAFINLHLKNTQPVDAEDFISLEEGFYGSEVPIKTLRGQDIDTLIKNITVKAKQILILSFLVKKDQKFSNITKVVTPKPFSTIELYVEY